MKPAAVKVGATPQPPVQVVAPGVVRADDRLPRPPACVDEPRSPVPAHVLECANGAALPAHEDHRYAAGIDRLDVAAAPDLVGPAGQHPAPAKEVALLELEEFAGDVGRVGKTGRLCERRVEAVEQRVRQEVLHSRRCHIDSPAIAGGQRVGGQRLAVAESRSPSIERQASSGDSFRRDRPESRDSSLQLLYSSVGRIGRRRNPTFDIRRSSPVFLRINGPGHRKVDLHRRSASPGPDARGPISTSRD